MFKKAQGISISYIVIIAIAVIVLVLIVAWGTGALTNLFGKVDILRSAATPEDITAFRLGCSNHCHEAKQLVKNPNQWTNINARYCQETIWIDTGEKTEDEKEILKEIHCWDDPVASSCSFTINVPEGAGTAAKHCDVYFDEVPEGECRCD